MSKLDKLLRELCPDGVEHKKLVDAVSIERGKRVVRSQLSISGKYPVYQNSLTPLGYHTDYNYNANTTFIIVAGAAGEIGFSDKAFWAADDCFAVVCPENILNRYIYHLLLNNQNQLVSKVRKASIPRLSRSAIENLVIPIPPLDVQREIVRILDNFTELTVELTAELIARQKQYAFYRNKLLTFGKTEGARIERIPLGDIGSICMCKRILKSQTNTVGGVPFYKIGTFGKKADSYISQETFDEYRLKYNFPKKGDVLISAAGTIGRTVVYDGEPAYFQDSNIVWIDNDESVVLNSYLRYCYELKPWKVSSGGTIQRLYNDNIAKAVITVPPLDVQSRIVNVLDNFEKICSDLNIGLPAEIEARQKQYEYYRDKLLTFAENGNTILSRAEQSRAEQSRAEQSRAER